MILSTLFLEKKPAIFKISNRFTGYFQGKIGISPKKQHLCLGAQVLLNIYKLLKFPESTTQSAGAVGGSAVTCVTGTVGSGVASGVGVGAGVGVAAGVGVGLGVGSTSSSLLPKMPVGR